MDDPVNPRDVLEPAARTHFELAVAVRFSIAISLKRIADALDQSTDRMSNFGEPKRSFRTKATF